VKVRKADALALLLGLACASSAEPPSGSTERRRPNIVLLYADDLGWGDLGCYGDDYHQTPNLDRLSAEGMRFTDAYASAAICSPSRASVMSGKYPARLRITDWIPGVRYPHAKLLVPDFTQELGLGEETLAERLRGAGYATLHVGKWHLGGEGFWPLEQGFDVNVGGHSKGAPGSYFHPYAKKTPATDWTVRNLPPGGREGDYLTERLTDEALALIDAHVERPFFLYMSYYTVHTPIEGVPEKVAAFRERRSSRVKWAGRNAAYAAMVASLDDSVGRILKRLDERGLTDDTLVLFSSDNGGVIGIGNNGGLREGKGFLYEGGIREPLLARWPGVVEPGSECAVPVTGADLFATLSAAGGASGAAADGLDLAPLLRDPTADLGRDALFWHYPHYHTPRRPPCSAIRSGANKLLEWHESGALELYDLVRDPGETTDLAASEPELARALKRRLDTWRAAVDAQSTRPNPEYDPEAPFSGGYTAWDAETPTTR
jgi:arylsulfatase A-like enzyme